MTKRYKPPSSTISADEYTREYYEECCHGYEEFHDSYGDSIPARLTIPIELAKIEPGMFVVDLGCGRGEVVLNCARRDAWVWGLDYSIDALRLSKEIFNRISEKDVRKKLAIQQANAINLPFANENVDVVFMLDIVEHLNPSELERAFTEAYRILKVGGQLIIHTMPNLWYYRHGYPLYRLLQRIRGQILPRDPRSRWAYSHVHINEQTPISLKNSLTSAGFNARVWLMSTQNYDYETNGFVRFVMKFITSVYPFRWIFCNDIIALAVKA